MPSCRKQQLTAPQHLGFKGLGQGKSGPKKVKILPESWPTDCVPPACATLLSVDSNGGLLAAAGPKSLVVTSTAGVRKAFQNATKSETETSAAALESRDADVVSDFTPDITMDVPTLRHVAFSSNGEFLVMSTEDQGRIIVFEVDEFVKKGNRNPKHDISTDGVPLRALVPNYNPQFGHYFAAVFENGTAALYDVSSGAATVLKQDVECVDWSTKGKAVLLGQKDGSATICMSDGVIKTEIPRPPELDDSYTMTGLAFLDNTDYFMVHSKREQDPEDPQDNVYHVVKSAKLWASHTYHPFTYDALFPAMERPSRALPPRLSMKRLRHWEPSLDDMLIITSSHTDSIAVFATTSGKIAADQDDQDLNRMVMILLDDAVKAGVPRTAYGEDMDSVFIGEALDLSSTEKLRRPVPALEEIDEAPWPLPAYMGLTHEGLLAAWWVVWNKSIEAGTRYPGLTAGSPDNKPSETPMSTPAKPMSSEVAQTPATRPQAATTTPATGAFARPSATFGSPAFGSPTPGLMKPTPPGFGTPGFGAAAPSLPAPTFGKTTQPAFGATSAVGTSGQGAFGAASAFGKPAQPMFGSTSTPSAGAATFGSAGGLGGKPSPWAASSQTPQTQPSPFSAAAGGSSGFAKMSQQSQSSPFAAAASGSSGFAKMGQNTQTSSFSSFGSNTANQSGFGAFGQGQQKSGFGNLNTEPSFGSTVTVDSGAGSTLPSWANTPAQGSGGIFGQAAKSSFNTSSFESKQSDDTDDADGRKRDEATPTPQNPAAQKSQNTFGLQGGFKLGTTFSSDGTAKDDPAKPGAPSDGSFFGSDFKNMLGRSGLKPPATPSKESPEETSTTPASPPKQKSFFPSTTSARESATPKAAPPQAKTVPVDDAPLPPDFTTYKAPKMDDAPLPPDFVTAKPKQSADDDLPPLAGSPPVNIEAPSSDADVSPVEEEEDEESFDEEEDDEEVEESSPANRAPSPKPLKTGWSFDQSAANSPRVLPAAPTPPPAKSMFGLQAGQSATAAQQSAFGQASKPAPTQSTYGGSSIFGQKSGASLFGDKSTSETHSKPNFPPPAPRPQEALRSPSPVRSSSASGPRVRREPIVAPGAPLSASIQKSRTPTPQPQISDLEDEEDERMREQLARPIEPTRLLDDFVAYQNYTGKPAGKTGHAAQIETIYRDINGMVDALGWNARSIKSFTQYHKTPQSNHKVDREVLEDVASEGVEGSWFENFTICEIEALRELEDELELELDAGRVQDVLDKLQQLARLLRDKAKLMTRLNDIRRQIILRKDPQRTESSRKAPLPQELADSQKALRHDYAQLLTSLGKAEDAIISLRSSIASHNAQNGKTGAIPTMDAVRRTCLKLAAMAETKNNDIVLLESQMKKIGLTESGRPSSSPSRTAATPRRARTSMRNSVAESTFATPPTSRSTMSLRELNRRALTPDAEATPTPSKGYGLFYTPEGSPTSGKELARLSDAVDQNMGSLKETARRRKQVAAGLKKALVERGIKTTKVN